MSAAGQIRDLVEAALAALTGRYDERLDTLEARVTTAEERLSALEQPPAPETAAPRRARPAAKAQAGTANVKGDAPR